MRGKGGELHQTASGDIPVLTTQQGTPVSDDQNSLKLGRAVPRRWKIFTSGRKSSTSITNAFPSALFMPGAYGAHGYFENYDSLADVTSADIFQRPGKRRPHS